MKDTIKINETEVNFDVLNALNLHHPHLGEAYSNFGWNPLGDDFSLDLPFIEKYLESARFKPEDKAPAFLEKGPKAVMDAFKNASENNKEMLETLKKRLEQGEFNNVKGADISGQVKDIVFFLECRQKMLEVSIGQISSKKIDALKAYKNINSINRKLSQLLEEAYQKEFNKNVALGNMLLEAQLQNKFQQGQTKTFSDNLISLLGKNFSLNQIFSPDNQKEISLLDQLKENLATLSESVTEITQAFSQESQTKTQETAQEIKQETAQENLIQPQEPTVSNDFKLSDNFAPPTPEKRNSTPTRSHTQDNSNTQTR